MTTIALFPAYENKRIHPGALSCLLPGFLLVAAMLLPVTPAQSATITVTGLTDALANDGTCSIREAIINANNDAATWPDCAAGSGTDTIVLPAGTITLSIPNSPSSFAAEELSLTGDLDITSSMIINGHASGTVIDAVLRYVVRVALYSGP